jgi:DNA-binding response OmpR family regulator
MDGFDFAKALREVNHTVPCYALSGSITDVDEARLRMAGFDGTLAKPIDLEKVEGIINGLKKPEYQH